MTEEKQIDKTHEVWHHFQERKIVFVVARPRLDFILRRAKAIAPRGAKLLNIGLGEGYLETGALAAGFRVNAVDPDAEALEKLHRSHPGINIFPGVIDLLPFPDGSMDVVIATEVLEHLGSETRRAGLVEIRRVLRRGGYFVGTVPFDENLRGAETMCPRCSHVFHRWGHQERFDIEAARSMLESGFRVAKCSIKNFPSSKRGPIMRAATVSALWAQRKLGYRVASPVIYWEAIRT